MGLCQRGIRVPSSHWVVWVPAAEHRDPASRRYAAEKYKPMFLSAHPHKRQPVRGPNGWAGVGRAEQERGSPAAPSTAWLLGTARPGPSLTAPTSLANLPGHSCPRGLYPSVYPAFPPGSLSSFRAHFPSVLPLLTICTSHLAVDFLPAFSQQLMVAQLGPVRSGLWVLGMPTADCWGRAAASRSCRVGGFQLLRTCLQQKKREATD